MTDSKVDTWNPIFNHFLGYSSQKKKQHIFFARQIFSFRTINKKRAKK